tara:strand:- start:1412 stop:1765 length:354 start_codon:yes stop_codon:yes gene_type:complete
MDNFTDNGTDIMGNYPYYLDNITDNDLDMMGMGVHQGSFLDMRRDFVDEDDYLYYRNISSWEWGFVPKLRSGKALRKMEKKDVMWWADREEARLEAVDALPPTLGFYAFDENIIVSR